MIGFRPVLHICGMLLCVMAVAMVFPALADAATSNPDWVVFVASAAITAFIGGALVLATRTDEPLDLSRRQAFLLTTSAWGLISLVSTLPLIFYSGDISLADAFFETVSGITTTGSTVLTGLETLPPGILLWRSMLQWVGAVGVVLMAMVMLPFLGVGGMALFQTESSEQSGRIVPRSRHFVAYIAIVYSTLTVLCLVLYAAQGMSFFDALNHAMTSVATGGFSTYDASFGQFDSPGLQWTAIVFMILGGIPFVAYIRFLRGQPRALYRDSQIRTFILFILALGLCLGLWLAHRHGLALEPAIRAAMFNVTSIVTTTGYASADYNQWGPTAVGLFFALMFIGGCTGSTSGGIKIFRHQMLFLVVQNYIRRLFSPNRLSLLKYGGQRITTDIQESVLAFIAIFVGGFSVTAVLLAAMGLDFITALSASASAFSNVGPGLGDVIGPAGNFSSLPDGAKWVLSGAMLLGRLELFTALVLLVPAFWRR